MMKLNFIRLSIILPQRQRKLKVSEFIYFQSLVSITLLKLGPVLLYYEDMDVDVERDETLLSALAPTCFVSHQEAEMDLTCLNTFIESNTHRFRTTACSLTSGLW